MRSITGTGWCGTYNGGDLGWLLSYFISHHQKEPLNKMQQEALSGRSRTYKAGDFYRVRITVTPLKDRRGKYIVKRHKGKCDD